MLARREAGGSRTRPYERPTLVTWIGDDSGR
jgi:hypothetical protein